MTEHPEIMGDFITITGYGTAGGLAGVNCRHSFWFVSKSQTPAYTREQLGNMKEKEADTKEFTFRDRKGNYVQKKFTPYEATQKMRQMENAMRKTRLNAVNFKNNGLDEAYSNAKNTYKNQYELYNKFCEAMKLRPQINRVHVDGLGRV